MSATTTWSDVLALVAQLDASGLSEAEVVSDGVSVRVSRTPGGLGAPAAVPAPTPAAAAPPAAAEPAPVAPAAAAEAEPGPSNLIDVTAPMLGVLYRRPAPDQPEFVTVGDVVEAGDTVAIIEVMKMMMPVAAEQGGRVVEVVVADGETVEHGAVLIRLEPVEGGAGQ